jgi:hypothetical protein
MPQTLSDDDIEAIAQRVVQIVATRLGSSDPKRNNQPATPPPVSAMLKLAYPIEELMAELGVTRTTVWRWEALELLKPVPHLRHKIYAREEVERFLKGQAGERWIDSPKKRRRLPVGEDAKRESHAG